MNWKWTQTPKFVLAGLLICSQNPLYSQSDQAGIAPGPQQNGGSAYGNILENAINKAGNAIGQATDSAAANLSRTQPLTASQAPAPAQLPTAKRQVSWGTQQDAGEIAQQIQNELQQVREQATGGSATREVAPTVQGSSTRDPQQFNTAPGAYYQSGQYGQYGSQIQGTQGDSPVVQGQAGTVYGSGNGIVNESFPPGSTNIGAGGNVQGNINSGIGQPFLGGLQNGQAVANGGFVGGPVVGGPIVDGGFVGGTVANGGIVQGPVVNGPFIETPVVGNVGQSFFSAGRAHHARLQNVFNGVFNRRGGAVNRVFGIGAIGLGGRDFDEDNVVLARDTLVPSRVLGTQDASIDDFGGVEATFLQRNAFGKGFEARYFGLFENDAQAFLPRQANSSRLVGLGNVGTSVGTGRQLFALDGTQSVERTNRINNFEINRLKIGGGRFLGFRTSMCEHYYGFRLFNFDETLNYQNSFATPFASGASAINYRVETDNQLAGLQTGQRAEIPLRGRFGLSIGGRFGAFNNRVRTRQYFSTADASGNKIEDASIVMGNGGTFDLSDEKNSIAFLGEFNTGLTMQLSQSSRARIGYRALGVSRLALADRQILDTFYDPNAAGFADTDGDMILQGGYFGLEFVR